MVARGATEPENMPEWGGGADWIGSMVPVPRPPTAAGTGGKYIGVKPGCPLMADSDAGCKPIERVEVGARDRLSFEGHGKESSGWLPHCAKASRQPFRDERIWQETRLTG